MNCMFCWLCVSTFIIALIWALCRFWIKSTVKSRTVCVIVLGDIGRSPRMQYHALSFVKEGFHVDIVGYSGSAPIRELRENSMVKIHYLPPTPDLQRLPKFVGFIVKTIWQSATLLSKLFIDVRTEWLIVQNPPAVPTMPIAWLYCRCSATKLIIDWHNYAYTIMAMNIGQRHILVKLTMFCESFFGARADKHFCVTKAMKDDLNDKWNIKADVLYDRPPEAFKPIDLKAKHSLLTRLGEIYEAFRDEDGSSRFTECLDGGEIRLKPSRPGFIVSSTSWTEDEDFSILFNALHEYEIAAESKDHNLPDLVCAVTGKGPLKEFWNAIIQRKKWQHVKVVTPWLENEDYPKLLACADLGICLHTSSSGLDLPMKVVDMFGCGLPVCAYNYKCLNELVRHEENSLVFSSDKQLAEQIQTWFDNHPTNEKQKNITMKYQCELTKFRELRWHGNWSSVVLPSFQSNHS